MRWPILLVEDNPDDHHFFQRAAEKSGWNVEIKWAPSAEEAIEILASPSQGRFRLIVVDLRLPCLSGTELISVLNRDGLAKHVPKVVLSTSSLERDIFEAAEAGANSYLKKPLKLGELDCTIKAMLDYWLGTHLTAPLLEEA